MAAQPARTRIAVDVEADVRQRLRVAAARRDESVSDFVRRVLAEALDEELRPALSAEDDPVLAELWDNDEDRVYDDA